MVCYDITNPRSLKKTAKTLEDFGLRVQKSFFQCNIDKDKMDELYKKISKIINKKKDSFYIYPLCEDCSKKALSDGSGVLIRLENYEIL
jgi:CRISPR-associated protein Cas2